MENLDCEFRGDMEDGDDDNSASSGIWIPPEPADLYDDDDDLNLTQEGSGSHRFKKEKQILLEEAMDRKGKPLVKDLLNCSNIASSGKERDNWADIVTSLSLEAASFVKPDATLGNHTDPDQWLKIKCLSTGSPSQSRFIRGLIFNKHAVHKHLPTKYNKPRLLLIQGTLGLSSSELSSSESDQQTKDCGKSIVDVIETCNPDVVLVEESVSRDIQEYIISKGLTLIVDMKPHQLEIVARCTISPSLSSETLVDQKLRQCDSLYFENFIEEHASSGDNGERPSKTLMFINGCPTRLGCTILLMGSNGDELKKVKQVILIAAMLAYSLVLETSILLDQKEMFLSSRPSQVENLIVTEDLKPSLDDSASILLMISSLNSKRGTICDNEHLTRVKFYHESCDMPLGKFLQDNFLAQRFPCKTCGESPESHIFRYAHGKTLLKIQVRSLPPHKCLPGETEGKIWMWSRFKNRGSKTTKRVLMSSDSLRLSFAKFLQLSFWDSSGCSHSFPRDSVYFFGLGSSVAMFEYSSLTIHSMSLPPLKLEFSGLINEKFCTKKPMSDEGAKLHIPLESGRYIVSDYEGELSSIIACALAILKDKPEETKSSSSSSDELDLFGSLVSLAALHPEVLMGKSSGQHKYSVFCPYAGQFRCLRDSCCPSEVDFIASLSRCRKGGDTDTGSYSFIAKTLDDRFIIKEIKRNEFDSFLKFAPSYIEYMNQCIENQGYTCLAKVLGVYQVTIRSTGSGKETRHYLMVMENIFFGKSISRQYELNGAGGVDDMSISPIYIGNSARRNLQRAVYNDSSFLKSMNVMDYSLFVGVDSEGNELVCGIIDYLRQYTWDKQLLAWFKSSFAVLENALPAVIAPKEYKKRFRNFIDKHFHTVPDNWAVP